MWLRNNAIYMYLITLPTSKPTCFLHRRRCCRCGGLQCHRHHRHFHHDPRRHLLRRLRRYFRFDRQLWTISRCGVCSSKLKANRFTLCTVVTGYNRSIPSHAFSADQNPFTILASGSTLFFFVFCKTKLCTLRFALNLCIWFSGGSTNWGISSHRNLK